MSKDAVGEVSFNHLKAVTLWKVCSQNREVGGKFLRGRKRKRIHLGYYAAVQKMHGGSPPSLFPAYRKVPRQRRWRRDTMAAENESLTHPVYPKRSTLQFCHCTTCRALEASQPDQVLCVTRLVDYSRLFHEQSRSYSTLVSSRSL